VNISGATSATYTIPWAQSGDAGSYDCVVTNPCGSVTSSVATLSVGEHWLPGDPVAGVERSAMSTTAWDPDGPGPRGPALVVGGAFTVASNIKAKSIAMLDLQTMEWSALGSGTNGQVYALAALPDGDLVAGGSFTTAGGVTVNFIARWNGTSWSPLGTGMSGPVEALAILPNGDLLAAGDFTSAGGVVVNGVARWDGASWSDLGGGMNDHVRALAVLASGDVIAGGDFTAAGGVAADHVARWNGVAWSAMGSGMNDTVEALAAHPDGRVVAGGSFFGGIRVWNGTSWSTPGGGTNGRVESLVVLANGDVIAGGLFYDTFSQPGNMIARWNGTSWSSLGGGVDYSVRALTLLSNGDLIAAGRFSLAGGVAASGVARWDGASWSALGTGTNDQISALAFLNGDVIAGGEFVSLAGVSANRIARWSGDSWSAMGTGMNRPVHAVATLPNGDVIAGGAFTEAGGVSANRIARWNGSTWSALGPGMNGTVHALAVLANGDVIAGGAFTEVGGVTMNRIARWNGTSWSSLGTGMSDYVYALAVLANGDLLAGGLFTQAGGIAASRLARWNGVSWSPMFTGGDSWSSGQIHALAVLDNGDVIAGGAGGLFVSGRVTSNIARWDGVSWSRMGDGTTGSVYAITQVPNGDVIVGGTFWAASGPDFNYIARWNGVAWSTMGAGMNGWVYALAARPDGGVIAGGDFTTAGGRVSAHFARYSSTGSPAAIALTPSRTFCTGGTATLSASVADGYPNVSFQWRRNGALVADGPNGASPGGGFVTGATGTLASPTASSTVTLTISSVAVADAGAYTCDFTSPCGTARSEKCTVTVNAITPSITSQPSSISRCAGTSASFTVGASGTSSTFQWRKAGDGDAAVDAGPYDCVVSTPCGSVTSSTATLTVNVGPSITLQPSSRSACAGTSTTFTIVATGVPAPTFQWRKGGAPIVGATASTFTIASVAAADASSYDCVVTDGCASVVSSAATLAVNVVPSITSQPFAAAACLGSSAFFRVTSTGDSRTFQWRLDGVPIPGATASRYDIASMTAADAGSYDCIISNECGSVTSASATLTLRPVPGITTQPTSRSACVNASTTFSIAVSSSSQVQWRKDGVPIDGATSRNFTINPVIAASAGSYDCVVSTACSSITSAAASLTVNVLPSITVQPTPRTLCVGASTTFTVAATGTPELTFQWRRGVVSIPGATSASLTIASVAQSDAGSYTCVVTNSCGSVTSSSAPLTVNAPPVITLAPVSRTVCAGTLVEMRTSASSTLATTFQWRKGGVPIPGATSSTYVIALAAESDAGTYTCVATNECGSTVSGSATLRVNPVPGNDGISDAFTLAPGVALQGDTTCASIDAPDAATCDGQAVTAPGLWYRLAGTGTTVTVSLCGSEFDTRLSAFCGAPGSRTCVAGNDNSCESSSSVTFCTRPGSDYFILVHGVNLAKGRFTILATDTLTACDTAIECSPTGACCLGSACSQLTVAACESAGGSFLGAGTACEMVSYDDRHQSPGPFPAAILDFATVTASIVVPPGSGDVEGLAVRVGISHSYVGDLDVTLTRGSTTVSLIGTAVSSGSDLDGVYTFADSAATTFESASFGGPVVLPGVYRPDGELSVFNGQSFEGTWTLSVRDTANIDVGWLRSFTLATTTTTTTECDACPPCAADYNLDGGIDSGDIESFFTAWEGSEPCADVNADGGIDFGDISDFYAAWELGGC
jgi:subtilisin-like proprotein convertase family protein